MPHSSTDSGHDTRTRLLEAAVLCFAEKGFEGTGIREIAQRAQANSALVQYHFGGKEGLYEHAFRFLVAQKHSLVAALPPIPEPGTPGAHELAVQGLQDHVSALFHELMEGTCAPHGGELERAAGLLWSRETQDPRPGLKAFLPDLFQPYVDHLEGCLKVLCPHLDAERRFECGMAIHGMAMFYRTHLGIARAMRQDPEYPRDLDRITRHLVEFTFRGLGLACPPGCQGA
ncbi:MAG: CerR family C-terminal domain-containing protein [Acidobacteria bacterium]|nr:CerR family C-terminal domain-containing protein [Acidobacteriota bacterium]